MEYRDACVICDHHKITKTCKLSRIPIYMGVSDHNDTRLHRYEDMVFGTCDLCSNLQLIRMIPIEELYAKSHNKGVIGRVWRDHNKQFVNFLKDECDSFNKVMEIGDPSCKIANESNGIINFDKWYIVEPTGIPDNIIDGVEHIAGIFDEDFESPVDSVDVFVMSHVFEHLYDPQKVLKKIRSILKDDGSMFISVPDLQHCNENMTLPLSGMHFEHTFYIDVKNMIYILDMCGFKIENHFNYINHSIFFHCKKADIKNSTTPEEIRSHNKKVNKSFLSFVTGLKEDVQAINKKIQDYEKLYLYGAHFPAQLMISLGMSEKKIVSVLDNSPDKIGKYLYGTRHTVLRPEALSCVDSPVIICRMGPYTEEIKKAITKINNEVIFI